VYQQRLNKLKNTLKKEGIDALIITNPVNVYYMSGFRTDVSSLVISKNANIIITDFRYRQDAEEISGFMTLTIENSFKKTLNRALKDEGVKKLGFEASHLSYSGAQDLKTALSKEKISMEPLSGAIEQLRLLKDADEIAEIKKAVCIAKKVLGALKPCLRPGISERSLARLLEGLILDHGGDGPAFDTIVASGKNSSRPHAYITDKRIQKDEHVLIDFGVRLNQYNCDLTRVLVLGKIQKILNTIYNICAQAQERAIRKLKVGASIKEIDRAARGYIASKGFGKFFGHSLGHGVGLSVHELPRIFSKSDQTLKPGMVFTIEPGIYIEGIGGVRTEDMVLVTERGYEILTDDIPK
jgi:Xaa-Pro aminopeptidase